MFVGVIVSPKNEEGREKKLLCAMTTAGANLGALPRQCETFSLLHV